MKYYVGIDLGGTNIVVAVVNENYEIIEKGSVKTNLPRKPELVVLDIENLVNYVLKKANLSLELIQEIGIGCPGSINPKTGNIEYSCNFDYHNVPIAKMLKGHLNRPVCVDNDANAAALGEFIAGSGRGLNSMVAITIGTGIGGGIIIDNKLYHGFNYNGGELGHIVIQKNGRPCNCGRNGCFEAYASATGLIKTTEEIMKKDSNSKMWDIYKKSYEINGRTAFEAAEAGDKSAKEVIDIFISDLAAGIVNIINIFQPQMICIGGGISKEGKTITDPLQKIIDKEDYARNSKNRCKVVTAKLGNDAGLIGAAMLFKFQ